VAGPVTLTPHALPTRFQAGCSVTVVHQQQESEPRMHLYEINPSDDCLVHVVARSTQEAVDLFVTWSAAKGRFHASFTVDDLPVDNLAAEQQEQVRRAFAAGLVGIAHFDEQIGWTFTPPMWQPLGHDEMRPLPCEGDGA